ncbi:MAG: sigma-54 dependent transcriptional regulator [Deltaproteobacteria bacterium]|jgi:transcriptional regulator with PAS, ATPase and Fis domain|nr:sigma-54 dependent transcriptional regulator [Deltaproteobacteria bacterium]
MEIHDDKALGVITRLCEDLAGDRPADEEALRWLSEEGQEGSRYGRLAEAFGHMLAKLNARDEERLSLLESQKEQLAELEEARAELAKRNVFLQKSVSETWNRPLLGKSEVIVRVIRTALEMAKRPINTMILGPTGSGKEVLAKMIFFNSPRAEKDFVAVNCSAIPATLFESEMFGIEKGVATGVSQRKGLIEGASGGTLFLDEVGDMTLENQAKLLRVLEEREVMRVGGHKPIPVDLHVISATNANVWEAVRARRFREDLYYRLNVLELKLPPLSERREDILLLARHFLKKHATRLAREDMALSDDAEALLEEYSWPGNVRELNNEMERAASISQGSVVGLEELSERIRGWKEATPEPLPTGDARQRVEGARLSGSLRSNADRVILETLGRCGGNKTKAAKELGMTREGLRKRLKKLGEGIPPPPGPE